MLRQALGEQWWWQSQGYPSTEGKAAPKALPVLRGIGEGRDDVLLDEEEHGEEKSQSHGTHHRPNGQGLHRGQHKQAVRGVVVEFGHCKEEGNDVRRHLLVQPFYSQHKVLWSKQENRRDAPACGSLEAMEDGSIWLVWFIFYLLPLRTWLPSWWDRLLLVLARHYRYWSNTKERNLFWCKVFLDEEALFLTSTVMLSSSTHKKLPHLQTSCARHFSIKSKSKLCCHWKQSMARDKSHMATHHFAIQLDGMAITIKKKKKSHFLFVSIHFLTSPAHVTAGQCNSCPHYHFLIWKSWSIWPMNGVSFLDFLV